MQDYVVFLNGLDAKVAVDWEEVEKWWIERIHDYFSASPLKLKLDRGTSLRNCLRSVFEEAATRQAQSPGATVVGAVMQHLVGAKLNILYPDHEFKHHGYSVADSPTNRSGDFLIGDSVIHVTTAPTKNLLTKCEENLGQNLHPLIVSSAEGAAFAQKLGSELGLQKRIDVLDIEQFLVTNIIEWSKFDGSERKSTFEELVHCYNEIIQTCETDPSLRIELA